MYHRWANKRTYNAMVRNNELINWETGERLAELEDGEEPETGSPPRSKW